MKLARKAVLSGNALKLIAIAAMTVDHLTWVISRIPNECRYPSAAFHRQAYRANHVFLHRGRILLYA